MSLRKRPVLPGYRVDNHVFAIPESDEELPHQPGWNLRNEFVYHLVKGAMVPVMRAQDVKYYVHGSESVPASGGVLLAGNHTGYYDFIAGAVPGLVRGRRPVRYMAKAELWEVPVLRQILLATKHIPVDRSKGSDSIEAAVASLQAGEVVGIYPDGTLSRSFELSDWKTGAARIAQRADVPLIPFAIWGSQRFWTKGRKLELGRNHYPVVIFVGEPVDLSGTPEEVTERLVAQEQKLLDEARAFYNDKFGPFEGGLDWMPASMGGSAPTLEEARELNRREKEERAARKTEKAARKAGKAGTSKRRFLKGRR